MVKFMTFGVQVHPCGGIGSTGGRQGMENTLEGSRGMSRSWNHRMAGVGRDFKDNLIPNLSTDRGPPTGPGPLSIPVLDTSLDL